MPYRFLHIIPLTLLTLSACTQDPAQIDLKGQETFGRGASNGYASNHAGGAPDTQSASIYQPAPVYTNSAPVQSVASSSIGISDVAPPSEQYSSKQLPPNTPFKMASPPPAASEIKPQVQTAAPVNAWTQQPRFSDNAMPQEAPAKPEKPAAQLDQVIGNAGETKNAKADTPASEADKPAATESGFVWPTDSKKIISGFGPKGNGKSNDGINIAASEGEPVWAAASGEVVYAGNELPAYGNMVLIKHKGGKITTYAHLNRIVAHKYDRVKQGDIIGYVGSTGGVKEPQLHFAIRDGKQPLDPEKYLN